jgi:protein phosphatase
VEPEELVVAEGSLIVLLGAPGSGKSTLAERLFTPGDEILSTDDMRRQLTGDAGNFGVVEHEVVNLLKTMGEIRLRHGKTTVIDSTGPPWVIEWATTMRARFGIAVVGIAINLDPDLCRARNRARSRTVNSRALDDLIVLVRRNIADLREQEFFDEFVELQTPRDVEEFSVSVTSAQTQAQTDRG